MNPRPSFSLLLSVLVPHIFFLFLPECIRVVAGELAYKFRLPWEVNGCKTAVKRFKKLDDLDKITPLFGEWRAENCRVKTFLPASVVLGHSTVN